MGSSSAGPGKTRTFEKLEPLDGKFEERGSGLPGLGEGDLQVGSRDRDGEAREPRTRTQVHDPIDGGRDVGNRSEAVQDVTGAQVSSIGSGDDASGEGVPEEELLKEAEG